MAENGRHGTVGYSLATVLTIVGMLMGAVGSFYGTRDQAMAGARAEIAASQSAMRAEYREAITHYVSREEFAQWKEGNRARADEQYYQMLNALQRIGAKLEK